MYKVSREDLDTESSTECGCKSSTRLLLDDHSQGLIDRIHMADLVKDLLRKACSRSCARALSEGLHFR